MIIEGTKIDVAEQVIKGITYYTFYNYNSVKIENLSDKERLNLLTCGWTKQDTLLVGWIFLYFGPARLA